MTSEDNPENTIHASSIAVAEPGQGSLFTRLTLHVTGSTPDGFLRDLTFNEAPAPPPSPESQKARVPLEKASSRSAGNGRSTPGG
jgi:hypothetical protein